MAVETDTRTAPALVEDVEALVRYAVASGMLAPEDETWAYNAVLECVGTTGPGAPHANMMLADQYTLAPTRDLGVDESVTMFELPDCEGFDLEATIERVAAAGVAAGRDEDTPSGRDRIATRVMDILMPRPSEVSNMFAELYDEEGPEAATDWFYRLCCDARYVRTAAIAKNIAWTSPTSWGDLHQPLQAGEGPQGHRGGRCRPRYGRRLPRLPALHGERGLPRPRGGRSAWEPSGSPEPAHRTRHARR